MTDMTRLRAAFTDALDQALAPLFEQPDATEVLSAFLAGTHGIVITAKQLEIVPIVAGRPEPPDDAPTGVYL